MTLILMTYDYDIFILSKDENITSDMNINTQFKHSSKNMRKNIDLILNQRIPPRHHLTYLAAFVSEKAEKFRRKCMTREYRGRREDNFPPALATLLLVLRAVLSNENLVYRYTCLKKR